MALSFLCVKMKTFGESADLINNALSKNKTVIIGCHCSVKYSGRAESFLPKGDRLVVIKQDGSLLIHQPYGSSPVNYMKEGASLSGDTDIPVRERLFHGRGRPRH